MKKIFAIIIALIVILSITACGNDDVNQSGSENNPSISQNRGDNQGDENSTENNNQGDISVTGNGQWPKNEWTSHVPEADGIVLRIDENWKDGLTKAYVLYMDWTDEDAVAYGKKLVEAGKVEAINEDISDGVFYLLYTDPETGRMVMINEIGETENDYVIVLYK